MPPAQRRTAMSGDEFERCLIALGWTHRWLAGYLGLNPRMVDRFATGAAVIPDNLADWLRLRASLAAANPFPADW